jgi:hypothetical protein
MIQKQRGGDARRASPAEGRGPAQARNRRREPALPVEVLNEDEAILVLVDEAHRTRPATCRPTLLAGLPNCARIGFTGTPIIMGDKKRTHEIFGEFIDRYTIKEAEADGATCPCSTRAAPPTARSRTAPAWTSCSRTCSASTRLRNWRRSSRSTPPRATSSRRRR